ncbi:craniofacial development protein 2 [Elysia marginata]|uniref:Craniofacial development protein 2 n=1 Tax=Elysia marginata TaxID=1093978 RepID=A0AAV4HLC0_9GAST|nr:craniofacial development protein 2 [Elysia marginata]
MKLLMLRKISRLGSWNVRTLYQTGKLKEVARDFNACKLDILEIRETRWTGNGRATLDTGETMLCSDEEDANYTEGVGLILSRQPTRFLLGWQPEGPSIVSAMFKTNKKKINLRVINCYAPTIEKGEDVKERLYARRQGVQENSKSKDITILMGDFNAQIGNDNT